ncbi:hypothetical protein B296_00030006 [Ensete ventricosum]|uniref:Uncharacterized protein n=1 Tax=Ensete ventricosum TaxID=4639 RepID=A0A426XLK1_ENSVE|nr:hypothetical protein B296_00030006 [Ensete ventricosum]
MGSRMSTVSRKNATIINLCKVTREVEFRSIFHAPSRKLKMLVIPNVLAHGKSYKHGFVTKRDSHKHCAKLLSNSSFDRFFLDRLENSKY